MKRERMHRSICASTGKNVYGSYFDAREAAHVIKDTIAEDHGRPYRCSSCKGWHLGRSNIGPIPPPS